MGCSRLGFRSQDEFSLHCINHDLGSLVNLVPRGMAIREWQVGLHIVQAMAAKMAKTAKGYNCMMRFTNSRGFISKCASKIRHNQFKRPIE